MTKIGSVYGEALYMLAKEEGLSETIRKQLCLLRDSFCQEPEFVRLLSSPVLPKAERFRILDNSFQGRTEPYLLNFLKILTNKGYLHHFPDCVAAYVANYDRDNGILRVTATSAVPLSEAQTIRLKEKLHRITGKNITLVNTVDSSILGGLRLVYDGQCLDDTVSHRLSTIRKLLNNTAQ